MQANQGHKFFRNFLLGLVASGAGAFVALPSAAAPDAAEPMGAMTPVETLDAAETTEVDVTTEADALMEPAPVVEETDALTPAEDMDDVDPIAEDMVEDEALAEDSDESEVVADEMTEESEVVADEMTEEMEPVAEEPIMEAEPVAEEEPLNPVAEDSDDVDPIAEDMVEDEALAGDSEEVEPVAEEPIETEPVADEMMEEEPVAEEEPLNPVAEDSDDVDPIAEDMVEDEALADEDTEPVEAPVAEEGELNTEEFTIAELTDSSDSFEILAAALAAADLTEVLAAEGPYTVFAPTDEAFEALPEGAVEQLLDPENKDVLVQVLTYHVVPGAILSTDLEAGEVATVEGSDITVALGDAVTVNNANVVMPDVEASNGVIHVIDRVIIPPAPEAGTESEVESDETAAAVE